MPDIPDPLRCPVCHGTGLLRWWREDDARPCPVCQAAPDAPAAVIVTEDDGDPGPPC